MNISLKNISEKNIFIRYMVFIVAEFVAAINYNLFLNPFKIVSGGTNGLSILGEQLFGWSPAMFILIFSVIILILSAFVLGIEKTSSALVAAFIYPIFVEITSGIVNISDLVSSDMILISIISGVISGVINGLVCKIGLSQGGISLVAQILEEKFSLSVTRFNFFLNMFVVLGGGFIFGVNNMMYALIMLYITSIVMDRVLLGISSNKSFFIVTTKEDQVKEFIMKKLGHGVTIFNVKGGYEDSRKKVIMTVIPTAEYYKTVEGIKDIDESAFFVVTDSYEVKGGA